MLDNNVKQEIQEAYSCFLNKREWSARTGQKEMIAAIARSLSGNDPAGEAEPVCVVEAGTGTGKTVAYCVAAIPVARSLEKTLVIATATVALQEQIVLRDLPDLQQFAEMEFTYALAKGRSRYLCPARLDQQLENMELDPALALYPDEVPLQVSDAARQLYQEMLDALASGEWDGDKDGWGREIDSADWFRVTTDHRQCTGRRCAYISQCPFYRARDELQGADVVVANHDLVLADLSLGGGAILPEPENSFYVFDEGHHLAAKSINHFASRARLGASSRWLQQLEKSLASLSRVLGGMDALQVRFEKMVALLEPLVIQVEAATEQCEALLDSQERTEHARGGVRYRFPFGIIPDQLRRLAEALALDFSRLNQLLEESMQQLRDEMDNQGAEIPRHELEMWYPVLAQLQSRAENYSSLWQGYANQDAEGEVPMARWLASAGSGGNDQEMEDIEVSCSPIQASGHLKQVLWERCAGAVVTSATLTALNSFARFMMLSGTPENACYLAIQSPFDFARAQFVVPAMTADPSSRDEHTREVTAFIESRLDFNAGNLVLFSSRWQMEEVFYSLERRSRTGILLQGDLSKQETVRQHRERIDDGEGSTIFGLASFAEGVDLPGDYCTHVVIAKLPFAVPDDPVEEAVSEWSEHCGGNPFMDIAVPDAAMKLVQASGRLLRNEKDSGQITLLDRRIVERRYGQAMLDSLPPYRLVVE
jgi:ATP-dependent DNA helicase DinG